MVDAAIAGLGIAYVPEDMASEALAAGHLQQVLDDWSPFFAGYHLSYPSRRQISPALAIVVDALKHRPLSQVAASTGASHECIVNAG